MHLHHKQSAGFSSIELLVVIAIFIVIASLSIPSLYQFQTAAHIDTSAAEIAQNLRRAQIKAIAGYYAVDWGVYFTEQGYVIFAGDDYATRDDNFDETYLLSPSLEVLNNVDDQIVFSIYSGAPDKSGEITLQNGSGEVKNITINSQGVIDYD